MQPEKEIKKLRANLLNQIDELEKLISRKAEAIMNIEVPLVLSNLPNEINALRDDIKFLKKEINIIKGQINLIDWLLSPNKVDFFQFYT